MSDSSKLCLTCCLVGIALWTVGAGALCLFGYDAPYGYEEWARDEAPSGELLRQWSAAFGRAQRKAFPLGSACGLVLGLMTYWLFRSRPSQYHVVVRPENRRKMLATTQAESVVPLAAAIRGAIVGVCIALFVLPLLSDADVLVARSQRDG